MKGNEEVEEEKEEDMKIKNLFNYKKIIYDFKFDWFSSFIEINNNSNTIKGSGVKNHILNSHNKFFIQEFEIVNLSNLYFFISPFSINFFPNFLAISLISIFFYFFPFSFPFNKNLPNSFLNGRSIFFFATSSF